MPQKGTQKTLWMIEREVEKMEERSSRNVSGLNTDGPLFSGERIGEVAILSFKKQPLIHVTDLDVKRSLHDYLNIVNSCDEIKALIIKQSLEKMRRSEYVAFYRSLKKSGKDQIELQRKYNAISQYVYKLVHLNKMIIHADSGEVISLFMNIGLACDYRIVSDNTVFQNPNIELDVVPVGAGVYFMSKMFGTAAASRIMFSEKDIDASQALQLGLVDEVAPLDDIDQRALEAAQRFSRLPSKYSIGIKKLLHYKVGDFRKYLELEHELVSR